MGFLDSILGIVAGAGGAKHTSTEGPFPYIIPPRLPDQPYGGGGFLGGETQINDRASRIREIAIHALRLSGDNANHGIKLLTDSPGLFSANTDEANEARTLIEQGIKSTGQVRPDLVSRSFHDSSLSPGDILAHNRGADLYNELLGRGLAPNVAGDAFTSTLAHNPSLAPRTPEGGPANIFDKYNARHTSSTREEGRAFTPEYLRSLVPSATMPSAPEAPRGVNILEGMPHANPVERAPSPSSGEADRFSADVSAIGGVPRMQGPTNPFAGGEKYSDQNYNTTGAATFATPSQPPPGSVSQPPRPTPPAVQEGHAREGNAVYLNPSRDTFTEAAPGPSTGSTQPPPPVGGGGQTPPPPAPTPQTNPFAGGSPNSGYRNPAATIDPDALYTREDGGQTKRGVDLQGGDWQDMGRGAIFGTGGLWQRASAANQGATSPNNIEAIKARFRSGNPSKEDMALVMKGLPNV